MDLSSLIVASNDDAVNLDIVTLDGGYISISKDGGDMGDQVKEIIENVNVSNNNDELDEGGNEYVSGGNEVIGGESEFTINNIILSYDIINDEFLSKRKELLEADQEKYKLTRETYMKKLMELFSLNAETIQEFDKELHELFILDNYSLLKVLFDRFEIKQKNLIKIVKEVNNKLNAKYYQNKIQLDDSNSYHKTLQQFVKLFEAIPKNEFSLNNLVIEEDKAICKELIEDSDESKVIDTSCEKCIYNRIYMYCDYLYKKINKLKNKFVKLEKDVLLIVEYFDGLDL